MHLTIEQRKKFRRILREIKSIVDSLEDSLHKQLPIDPAIIQRATQMNISTEPGTMMDAFVEIQDQSRSQYQGLLKGNGVRSFSCFSEYLNPDEPPAAHHELIIDYLEAIERKDINRFLLSIPPGHAKMEGLQALIFTSNRGWTTIGDLKIGDLVFSPSGNPVEVTDKSPIMTDEDAYLVTTDDGQEVRCGKDHLWTVRLCRKYKKWSNRTTEDLFNRQIKRKDKRAYLLPHQEALVLPKANLPIDPYVLGLWLGDGTAACGEFTSAVEDAEFYAPVLERAGYILRKLKSRQRYVIDGLHSQLKQLNLIKNKHVPDVYLYASKEQRLALLQGLMDTDGTVAPKGQCFFFNTNKCLVEAVRWLLYSLGIKNTMSTEQGKLYGVEKQIYHRVGFYFPDAFRLPRKLKRAQKAQGKYGRYIVDIQPIPKEPMQCITVASSDGLYLTGRGLIPTHNSTYGSHRFPAWYLGRNPTHRYLQSGHGQKFCELELGKVTKNIVDSPEYREIFPEIKLSRSSMANDAWALTNNKGRYLTRAVDQGISGFRAHIACVDDPFASRADAESPTVRKKVYDWFRADLMARMLPRGAMMVIATRWHLDDLIGRLEQGMEEGGEEWIVLNMPAFCEDEEHDPLGRKLGEALWPDFYTVEELLIKKANMPARDWNSLYRGRPSEEGGNVVKMDEMTRYNQLPRDILDAQGNVIKRKIKRKVLSVDSAAKTTERNDFTVCQVWIETVDGAHYLADVKRARVEFNDLVKLVNAAAKAWNVHAILVEDKGSGTQYIQYMKDKISPAPIIPIPVSAKAGKEFRFDGVSPMFFSGQVILPYIAPWLPEYEDELSSFPNGRFDDNVDATSQYLAWVRKKKGRKGSKKLVGTH